MAFPELSDRSQFPLSAFKGTINHAVFRKPTHIDRYLNYRSFHHPAIKSSVCKTLVSRAYNVCDKESIAKELDHLNVVLQQNGFPADKISLTPCTYP